MEQKKTNEKIQWQCNVNNSVTNVYYGLITRRRKFKILRSKSKHFNKAEYFTGHKGSNDR